MSKFVQEEGEGIANQCVGCKHFIVSRAIPPERRCVAFLGGIPEEIWNESFDHTKAYPGDRGFRFEPLEI